MSVVLPARTPLPRMAPGHGETVWWGMVLLVTIESVVFASLIMSYFYLRAGMADWPPGNLGPPDLLLPTANTLVLLASVVPVMWAERAVRRGDTRAVVLGKGIGQGLLVIFIVLKIVEYGAYDYDWASHAYGSIVWSITGFHVAHVLAVFVKAAVIVTLASRGYFDASRYAGVQANALYWYFVAAIWIPLYATLYLSHYVL